MRAVASKYAVITADDFGYSCAVNRAIARAYDEGILTSTSLMVTAEAAEEAIALAKERPGLAVGLHLVLVCGRSALSPAHIPHLIERSGQFADNPTLAGLRYQFQPATRPELREEIRAQLERFQETGLRLSHLDGHLHLHTHPVILGILAELAGEFGIDVIRLPREELGFNLDFDASDRVSKFVHSVVFRQLRRYGEGVLTPRGIAYSDRVYGLHQTGRISESYLLDLIPRMQGKLVEIYAHPSEEGEGKKELEALLSQRVRERFRTQGWELTNYPSMRSIL